MSNDTDNPSQSLDDDPLKDFKKATEKGYRENEDLKNKMFLGCFGLAAIMISAAAVIGKSQLDSMAWGIYAAQTVVVVLFVFGLQALAVALVLIASSNPEQPLWRWITCVWRWITGKKKDEPAPYTSYDLLARVANYMDMSCLVILAVWNIYMAGRIAVTLLYL